MIMKTYRDSMRSLGMLNESELQTIFGPLEDLQPLHKGKRKGSTIINKHQQMIMITIMFGAFTKTLTKDYHGYRKFKH